MRTALVQLGDQIRERHRLAELLEAAGARSRDPPGPQSDGGTDGGAVRTLRRPPRPRVRRRAQADGPALLHERAGTELSARLSGSGDDAQLPALARRRVAHHPELGLEPLELALLGLF